MPKDIIYITYLGTEYEILITNMGLAVRREDGNNPTEKELEKITEYVRAEGFVEEF